MINPKTTTSSQTLKEMRTGTLLLCVCFEGDVTQIIIVLFILPANDT
jgi:hypothetical protein